MHRLSLLARRLHRVGDGRLGEKDGQVVLLDADNLGVASTLRFGVVGKVVGDGAVLKGTENAFGGNVGQDGHIRELGRRRAIRGTENVHVDRLGLDVFLRWLGASCSHGGFIVRRHQVAQRYHRVVSTDSAQRRRST